jgi:two-component system sensor histidine kinase AlgZ
VSDAVPSARERFLIAFAVGAVTVGLRVLVLFATGGRFGRDHAGDVRMLVTVSVIPLLVLPWGLTILARFHRRRSQRGWWRMSAFVAGYAAIWSVAATALLLLLVAGDPLERTIIVKFATSQAAWSVVLLLIGDGIQGAIHSHRAALLERERRHGIDMAEATRTRQTIESRTRPDTVITTLESIAERTLADPSGARLLLLRLARHQRMLLTRPSPPSLEDELRIVRSTVALIRRDVHLEIGRCDARVDLDAVQPWLRAVERALMEGPAGQYSVACEPRGQAALLRLSSSQSAQPASSDAEAISVELPLTAPGPPPRPPETSRGTPSSSGSSAFTAALIVYVLTAVIPELRNLHLQHVWNLIVMTLASAFLWLAGGPAVYAVTSLCTRLRLSMAVPLSTVSALFGAAAVTAASFGVLRLVTTGDEFRLAFLPLVASRNANVAFVVCTSSFAAGLSRMWIAARADAMRAEHETVRAEARELEARFHPHFLFNALASIAGLIRSNPAAAGEMCRLLARLVARTRAYAGIPSWTVNDEVTLIDDYIAIQRRRFAERFRIAAWEVAPSARDAAIPRLSLQPLIENIFIHAVAASYDVISIGLSIELRGRMLAVEIWNDAAEGPPTPGHGRGLAFVSNRVRSADGRMQVVPAEDRFTVHLTIPVRKPAVYPMTAPIPQRA